MILRISDSLKKQKKILFVVECGKNDNTDNQYVDQLVKFVYEDKINKYQLDFAFMSGKDRYKDRSVVKQIEDKSKNTKECHVIYVIDVDKVENDYQHEIKNRNIVSYCKEHNYPLITFSKDIENCLLHHSVEDDDKTDWANWYSRHLWKDKSLQDIARSSNLRSENKNNFKSNIFLILDPLYK